MGTHAYCISSGATLPPPSQPGIGGSKVQVTELAGLCAWFSEHAQRPAAGLEQLRTHDQVVRSALSDQATPIPLRFGQWFPDRADLRRQLEARREHWEGLLACFAGSVEMGLRLARPAPAPPAALLRAPAALLRAPAALLRASAAPPRASAAPEPPAGSGREYLEQLRLVARARAAAEAGREELLAALGELVAGRVQAVSSESRPDSRGQWRVAHLVRRAHLPAYQQAVTELRRRFPNARISLTGPWPPYSFAADSE